MNILFLVGVIFLLVVPIYIGVKFKASPAFVWAVVMCGAFVVFASKIAVIDELSLGPLRAKMREKIREADASIKQLREISAVSSEVTLTNLMADTFMDGISLEKRLELHDKIIDSLKKIGVSKDQIAEADSNWRKGISVIYQRIIRHIVEQRKKAEEINLEAPKDAIKAGQEIEEMLDFRNWRAPTPQQISSVLKKYNIKSPGAEECIKYYDHFLKTGEIGNKERFIQER